MTQLPMLPDDGSSADDTPLPLIVAKRWNFPLAHIETEDGMYYAIQDWMRGYSDGDVRFILTRVRRNQPLLNASIKMLPYKSTDTKVYQRPYTAAWQIFVTLLRVVQSTMSI